MSSLLEYTVTLEPTERSGLLALDLAWEIDGVPTVSSRLSPELELRTASPVTRRLRYEARSYTRYVVDPGLPEQSLAPRHLSEPGHASHESATPSH